MATTTRRKRFRFPSPGLSFKKQNFGEFSGSNFQVDFPNGFTVSVADTSVNPEVQRISVAVMNGSDFIGEPEEFVTPVRMLAIMLETALRTD